MGSSQAPQPNKANTHKSHAQLPQKSSMFFEPLQIAALVYSHKQAAICPPMSVLLGAASPVSKSGAFQPFVWSTTAVQYESSNFVWVKFLMSISSRTQDFRNCFIFLILKRVCLPHSTQVRPALVDTVSLPVTTDESRFQNLVSKRCQKAKDVLLSCALDDDPNGVPHPSAKNHCHAHIVRLSVYVTTALLLDGFCAPPPRLKSANQDLSL